MFGLPADAAWIWLGLLLGSAAMFGVITGLPAASPDAGTVAETVDQVATSRPPASASIQADAGAVKFDPQRIALRGPDGSHTESYRFGPVTPVREDSRLDTVLEGRPPEALFRSAEDFRRSLEQARTRESGWRQLHSAIRVRGVSYGEVNGVLVGT